MSEITKRLAIAVSDEAADRITKQQMLAIFQEAIDNGDILLEANQFAFIAYVLPLIDKGALQPSGHSKALETRIGAAATLFAQTLRERRRRRTLRRLVGVVAVVTTIFVIAWYTNADRQDELSENRGASVQGNMAATTFDDVLAMCVDYTEDRANVLEFVEDELGLKHVYASQPDHRKTILDLCGDWDDSTKRVECYRCYGAVVDYVWSSTE